MDGVCAPRAGDRKGALAEYRAAAQLTNSASDRFNLGVALGENGLVDEAIAEIRAVVKLAPNDARAHYNLGVLLGQKGHDDQAISSYRDAIRIDPRLSWAHNNLSNALARRGDAAGARTERRIACSLESRFCVSQTTTQTQTSGIAMYDWVAAAEKEAADLYERHKYDPKPCVIVSSTVTRCP